MNHPRPYRPFIVRSKRGFTLISSIFLIALLLVLILVFGSFLTTTLHGVSSERYSNYAKQSALFGLQVAMGELQGAAGPDQRVTAPASIFDGTVLDYPNGQAAVPVAGQTAWTGVWSSDSKPIAPDTRPQANPNYPQYDPANPGSKANDFVGWLVSATNGAGYFALPTNLSDVSSPVSSLPASGSIPNYVALVPSTNAATSSTPYMQVQKVLVDQVPGGSRYCAFAVEDEGVKADLSWNQTPDAVAGSMATGQTQDARLSSLPGPDYGQLNGAGNSGAPFPASTYPLTIDNDSFLSGSIPLLRDPADIQSIFTATPPAQTWPAWLAQARPDIAVGSRGVLADVQRGGLRRDLSLAFEMDGNSQFGFKANPSYPNYNNASYTGPTYFNQTLGEFVGNGATDPLSPPPLDPGGTGTAGYIPYSPNQSSTPVKMPFLQRFVYRHQAATADLQRGPSWHLLRDYYNLYKRLDSSQALTSRATYPNYSDWVPRASATGSQAMFSNLNGLVTDSKPTPLSGEFGIAFQSVQTLAAYPANTTHYIWKPLQGQYAPVYLGAHWLYSIAFVLDPAAGNTTKYDIVLCVDELMYLWNPYNRPLNVPYFRIYDASYMPGWFNYEVQDSTTTDYPPSGTPNPPSGYTCASVNVNTASSGNYYLLQPKGSFTNNFTMQPGEVMVFSPSTQSSALGKATATGLLTANTGYDLTSLSNGTFYRYFPNYLAGNSPPAYGTANTSADQVAVIANSGTFKNVTVTLSLQKTGGNYQCVTSTSLPSPLDTVTVATAQGTHEDALQEFMIAQNQSDQNDGENSPIYPGNPGSVTISPPSGTFTPNQKYYFGQITSLRKPTQPANGPAVEIFSRLNPMPLNSDQGDPRIVPFNTMFSASVLPSGITPNSTAAVQALLGTGVPLKSTNGVASWGTSYGSSTNYLPLLNVPSSPLLSLEALNGATFGSWAQEPFQPLGNSYPSPYLGPVAASAGVSPPLQGSEAGFTSNQPEYGQHIIHDMSWYLNDGLFDRYYLSGIAPAYSLNTGYSATGSLQDTLTKFFSNNYTTAQSNPVLHPYLPAGKTAAQAVTDLSTLPAPGVVAGFSKLSAYSLVNGTFNVNSTSVPAWTAFLMANKNLPVSYNAPTGGSTTDKSTGSPYPSSTQPSGASGDMWVGFSRLSDTQIASLANAIVTQVKLRGPFMSLSDFINHRIVNDATGQSGALQSAIQSSGINSGLAGLGNTPSYPAPTSTEPGFDSSANSTSTGNTATGIPGAISQANLLLPLAPRLSARSDTFRIRAYGEVRSTVGTPRILSQVACEAIVQRVPDYVDTTNDPWDEGAPGSTNPNPNLKPLTVTNQYAGRRFKIVQFRWLAPNEL